VRSPSANDLEELARTARRTLSDAGQVTLLISGGSGPLASVAPTTPAVCLHERNGLPTFLCEPGAAVAAAGRDGRRALLTVEVREPAGRTVSLLLVGTLSVLGVDIIDETVVDIVALTPDRVVVECDTPANPTITQHEVPVELFARTEPGLRTADLTPIIEHTNAAHQSELCAYLARRHGLDIDEIGGAEIARLDERGAVIHWVADTGANTSTIAFADPAPTVRELADRLRRELLGG